MPSIEIYTQPGCPYCARAKALLDEKGAAYQEISAPQGSPARANSTTRARGRSSVPQIYIDGAHIGGCDDLMALDATGKLDAMLFPSP